MNYLISMAVCVAATVFSSLGGSLKVKYLIMSDVNVALVAARLGTGRKAYSSQYQHDCPER